MANSQSDLSYGRFLLGELLWVGPVVTAVTFLAVTVYKSTHSQELAAAIGIFIAAAAIVVALLVYRLQRITGHATRDLLSTVGRPWHGLSYLLSISVLTVTISGSYILGSPDDPKVYFAQGKKLVIGINGRLPGWSLRPYENGQPTGFDIELAKFLEREYGFQAVFKDLTQDERMHQWDGTPEENGEEPVDLVISTFSITDDRLAKIGMAGPYYLDVSTVWRNASKSEVALDGRSHGCAVKGTTGVDEMEALKKERDQIKRDSFVLEDPMDHLADCANRFFKQEDYVQYISSDWSILRAFNSDVSMTVANGTEEVLDPVQPRDRLRELYGIALPRGYTKICESLSGKLDIFLAGGNANGSWENAHRASLTQRRVLTKWHKPQQSNHAYCGR